MGTITRGTKAGGGTNFNTAQTIDPAEDNVDLNIAYTEINGNLDNDNVKAAAAIVTSKIAFDGCRVTNSGNISLLNATTTLMTFDTETFDTGTYHSTGLNTGRLVAPTTGKYVISGCVSFAAEGTPTDNIRLLSIRLNAAGSGAGGTLIGNQEIGSPTLATTYDVSLMIVHALTAADYVELFAYQNSGETINANLATAPSHFSIARLGA